MGSYQSAPTTVTSGQSFNLSITTFTEYLTYTTYSLVTDPTTSTYSTYTLTNNSDGTSTIVFNDITISGSGTYAFILNGNTTSDVEILRGTIEVTPTCYLKGTKILCQIDGKEQYINIENILPNTLIKTYLHGYKKIKILGWNKFKNTSNKDASKVLKLYKLSKEMYNDLFEDLFISGQHSILVDNLEQEQIDLMLNRWSKLLKIDNKYLLMAYASSKSEEILDDNEYELFQIILENDEDNSKQFGIWANGLLSETMSYNTFIRKNKLHNYYEKDFSI